MTALARPTIVVPRMPAPPAVHTGNPFTALGDIVADCNVEGCGWHAEGQRALVKKAYDDHYRQYHASMQQLGGMLLNHPRHQ